MTRLEKQLLKCSNVVFNKFNPLSIHPGDLFSTCKELHMKEDIRKDGEQYLQVQSKILQIYCSDMNTDFPKEYVTLRSSPTDNYSEVYGNRYISQVASLKNQCISRLSEVNYLCLLVCKTRLNNPFECPYNGSRHQDCACRNDYHAMGYTLFHRVRLDLTTMRIVSK